MAAWIARDLPFSSEFSYLRARPDEQNEDACFQVKGI